MSYAAMERRLKAGEIVILDGGTGTELERRGVAMDPEAWCGPATLGNAEVLEAIHRDYIAAGADIVTANTYASSRLMLGPAGYGGRVEEINRVAVEAAQRARAASGRDDVLVAGSLSHMCPLKDGGAQADPARAPSAAELAEAFEEMALLLRDAGCDLVLLEMMYDPARVAPAFAAAARSGLPMWAGFSARRGADGRVLGFAPERDIPFDDVLDVLAGHEVAAAGVMHTPSDLIGDAVGLVRDTFAGPLLAYPDSGHFEMPHWHFENVIAPAAFARYAAGWVERGVQIVGGCCGLSPAHIAALRPLKTGTSA